MTYTRGKYIFIKKWRIASLQMSPIAKLRYSRERSEHLIKGKREKSVNQNEQRKRRSTVKVLRLPEM